MLGRVRRSAATGPFLALAVLCSLAATQASHPVSPANARSAAAGESQTIAFGSRSVELTVNSGGDAAFEQRVTELVAAAGPVLEGLIGVPYPGPADMTISLRSYEQLGGYAGLAGCSLFSCHIRVSSQFDDTTLLHELTHAWTQSFRNRWLAEGMAEYISDRASAQTDGRALPALEVTDERPPYPLLEWLLTIDMVTAEEEAIVAEYEGYYWSRRFFEELEAIVGRDSVTRTLAAVVPMQAGTVGVRRFMDSLDDAGAAKADELFLRYVFPPDRASEVTDRRAARDRLSSVAARGATEAPELSQDVLTPIREDVGAWEFTDALAALGRVEKGLDTYLQLKDRLAALKSDAEAAGLPYPNLLEYAFRSWDFALFLETIDEAEAAVPAYVEAKEKPSAPRGFWQRIGLLGRSPDDQLERAAEAFESADFGGSIDHSNAAGARLEDAASRGVTNVVVATVVLGLVLAAAALILRGVLYTQGNPAGT